MKGGVELYICMSCNEVYKANLVTKTFEHSEINYCPKENCSGSVIELDELIAPTIIELNNKGYVTIYCCAGHWYDDLCNAYIYFLNNNYVPKEIPKYFNLEKHGDVAHTIRSRFNEQTDFKSKYDFVIEINKMLLEWAKSLPENEFI